MKRHYRTKLGAPRRYCESSKIDVDELFPYSEFGEKGDLKWAEHLERLANDFQYARMAEEELLLQSLFNYSKFQREVEQKLI